MNLTSLQHYRPSTTKFVYMCTLKKFQVIENSWYYTKNISSDISFCNSYGFQCCHFGNIYTYTMMNNIWICVICRCHLLNKRKQMKNNDVQEVGKVENWTLKRKNNCDQIVIMVQ
jgi:hypothetical protein